MALPDPNQNMGFEDFNRYLNGEMSFEEQHKFEKLMLENPVVAEAYEGFLSMNSSKGDFGRISQELSDALNQKIDKKKKKAIPVWTYAAAASVMVSIGAYWLVFLSDQKKLSRPEESTAIVSKPGPEQKPSTEILPKHAPSKSEGTPEPMPAIGQNRIAESDVPDFENNPPLKWEEAIAADEKEEQIVTAEPAPAPAFATPPNTKILAQKDVKARKTTVDTDFASSGGFASANATATDSLPAPLIGWRAYNAYLYKNAVSDIGNEQVTVTFTVNADGSLADFNAKGNQKNLFDLAIRIVRQGPAWKPAHSNGPVRASGQVTLQFHLGN